MKRRMEDGRGRKSVENGVLAVRRGNYVCEGRGGGEECVWVQIKPTTNHQSLREGGRFEEQYDPKAINQASRGAENRAR